jgi:hypothetical protein
MKQWLWQCAQSSLNRDWPKLKLQKTLKKPP